MAVLRGPPEPPVVLGDSDSSPYPAFGPVCASAAGGLEPHGGCSKASNSPGASAQSEQGVQVCLAAVGLVCDLCRALMTNILPYCDEIMQLLLENLGNENVHRSVKPQILSAFGDIALAIGGEFKKYLEIVLDTLQQASQAQVDKTDYDMVDYLNELREGCLEAYTGIIQGLKGDQENVHPDVMLVQPRVEFILSFIHHIAEDEDHSDGVRRLVWNISAACACVFEFELHPDPSPLLPHHGSDLCTAFGKDVMKLVEVRPLINELLTEGRRSKTSKTKTLATWATKELRKLKNQAWSSSEEG
ncbi:hypothetical protein JZ751_013235 [Albula glossodonta]|uniref:Importin subunit beta-1/Transportin-1-like TPR repeats domain-containing protein n=1 Tax=Albula glossodonta TaxID=121402 RepID=A0A8T2NUM3_9TELE|nr:hypothetical protein JZ751_013235 [Albula glossodonta]